MPQIQTQFVVVIHDDNFFLVLTHVFRRGLRHSDPDCVRLMDVLAWFYFSYGLNMLDSLLCATGDGFAKTESLLRNRIGPSFFLFADGILRK